MLVLLAAPGLAQEGPGYEAYERGDYEAAFAAWEIEAEDGDADAQYNLAVLYDLGQGVAQDKIAAARWYRAAAIHGHTRAQYHLALQLAEGAGLARDDVRAYMLLDLAADTDARAAWSRDRLAQRMAPGRIGFAARLARLAREGDPAEVLAEALTGILPGDRYSPEQLAALEDELTLPVQRALAALGYDPGPVDGVPGRATRAAIRRFQKDNGLPVDGEITQGLHDRLRAAFDARAADVDVPYGRGLLWRIETPRAAPSFIFGTMHSGDPRVLDVAPPVWSAFRSAASATFELDFGGGVETARAIRDAYIEAYLLTDGRTLDEIVGPERFADYVAALRPFGLGAEVLRRLKPWAIYMMLSTRPGDIAQTEDGGMSLDLWLAQQAYDLGKPLYGLETPDEQLAVFADIPEDDQVALLESAIAYTLESGRGPDALKRLYLARDVAGIFRLAVEPARRLGRDYERLVIERLLDDRNRVMVERMQGLLRHGNAFIAVGAAHLPGEAGILKLLERRGYGIARIY